MTTPCEPCGGLYFPVGGYACYWVLAPILSAMGEIPDAAALAALDTTAPEYLRLELFRSASTC